MRETSAVASAVELWALNAARAVVLLGFAAAWWSADAAAAVEGGTSVGQGLTHSCARTVTGGAQCAGSNFFGELGNGTTVQSSVPVDVVGLSSGVAEVHGGGGDGAADFSCALTSAGAVKCWGASYTNGSTTDQTTPVTVPGLGSGVSGLTLGGAHACAVVNGGVKCWGDRSVGQLGDGSVVANDPVATPVDVQGLGAGSGVTAISAGDEHTCAALPSGIKCWGTNFDGRLGDGTTAQSAVPVSVSGYTSATLSLAAGGSHTCALTDGVVLKCWGDNFYGQLGDGNSGNQSSTPVAAINLGSGLAQVVAGESFTCAVNTSGQVTCLGYNWDGELGDGTRTDHAGSGGFVGLDSSATGISAGRSHVCAALDTGAIQCWGRNDLGQFGNGSYTSKTVPVAVTGLGSGIGTVAGDRDSTCALTSGNGVKCWGRNEFSGQLGDGTTANRLTPVDVTGLTSGVSAIAVGGRHACALTTTGGVKCWGRNNEGQLGRGTFGGGPQTTAADVTGLTSGVLAIAAGFTHTCALTSANGIKCWGQNTYGQVGDNTTGNRNLPTDVSGLTSGVAAIAAGFRHSCAVTTGGGVKCWGANDNGGLGNGSTIGSLIPVNVSGLSSGVATVGTGTFHSCARTVAGGVKCWGRNVFNELGNGSSTDSLVPVDVLGLTSGVAQLAVGRPQSCVVTNSGGLKCWGNNQAGALGDGTFAVRTAPVDVIGLTSGVASITEFGLSTCAVTNAGAVKCWGDNLWGQIGDGSNYGVLLPSTSQFSDTPAANVDLIQVPPLPVPATSGSLGTSIATGPAIVVVGAPDSNAGTATSGQVFVYTPGAGRAAPPKRQKKFQAGIFGKALKATAGINLATLQLPDGLQVNTDKFGSSVAVSHDGSTVVVGAPNKFNDTGAVYIFQEPAGGWGGNTVLPTQTIIPPAAQSGDQTGAAVVITNAGTIVVGAPGAVVSGITGAGKGYVLRKSGGSYAVAETLNSSVPIADAHFGASISGEGSELAVGAPNQSVDNQTDRGAVQNFREQGGQFALRNLLTDLLGQAGDKFGTSVSIHDGQMVVGAPGHDQPTAADAGQAIAFEQQPTGTNAPTAVFVDPQADAGAALGSSISFVVDRVIIGAPREDVNGNTDQGAAAVYTTPPSGTFTGTVNPDGHLFDPLGSAGDYYGTSVASDGGLSAVGSPNSGTVQARKNRTRKALAGVVAPGEAVAYTDSIIFRDNMEAIRGGSDACISPNIDIPDNNQTGITSDLTLPVTGDVRDVNVSVLISHSFVSDLRISLIHVPTGRTVPLYAPAPLPASQCPSPNLNVEFDDQAVDGFAKNQCSGGNPAIDGRFLPNDWLTIMQGVTRAGPWRLKVTDEVASGTGTLQTWCVNSR